MAPAYRGRTLIGGVAAILTGLIWLVLTPFMATAGICDPACADWSTQPMVVRTVGRYLAERGAFDLAGGTSAYFAYGRFFPLVYLGLALGLAALHGRRARSAAPITPALRWSYRAALGGLVLAGLGDFASYVIGAWSPTAWSVGFGVEVLAWLVAAPGLMAYGLVALRDGAFPTWVGWAVVAAGVGIPLAFLDSGLIRYMPNRHLLVAALMWTALGVFLLRPARVPVKG